MGKREAVGTGQPPDPFSNQTITSQPCEFPMTVTVFVPWGSVRNCHTLRGLRKSNLFAHSAQDRKSKNARRQSCALLCSSPAADALWLASAAHAHPTSPCHVRTRLLLRSAHPHGLILPIASSSVPSPNLVIFELMGICQEIIGYAPKLAFQIRKLLV